MSGGRQPRSHKSWGLGVANTAEWTGTPRAEILNRAPTVRPGAKECYFAAPTPR